jgi:hypothetical protein
LEESFFDSKLDIPLSPIHYGDEDEFDSTKSFNVITSTKITSSLDESEESESDIESSIESHLDPSDVNYSVFFEEIK